LKNVTEENQKLWSHYQTAGVEQFENSSPRLHYLLGVVQKKLKSNIGVVLNIGAGNGYFEKVAVKAGVAIETLDLSQQTVDSLKQQGLSAFCGTILKMPFKNDKYKVVVASEVLEHLASETLPQAILEIHRVLAPGGYFAGTVPFNEKLLDNQVVCPSCQYQFHRWGHQLSFDRAKLSELFTRHGFSIEKMQVRAFVDWQRGGIVAFLKSLFRWALGFMGQSVASPHIYFLLKK